MLGFVVAYLLVLYYVVVVRLICYLQLAALRALETCPGYRAAGAGSASCDSTEHASTVYMPRKSAINSKIPQPHVTAVFS